MLLSPYARPVSCLGAVLVLTLLPLPAARAASDVTVLNDDGGWCWFQDDRAVLDARTLVVGSVANGSRDKDRQGDIDIVSYDLANRRSLRATLHQNLQSDDHASPALLLRRDGRWLAMYARHGNDDRIYYRISQRPHDATEWQPEKVFVPSASSRVTYSNLLRLKRDRATTASTISSAVTKTPGSRLDVVGRPG